MKKILLISAFLAATFGAYAQQRDTVETRDTARVYRDGAVRMRAHHSVTITAKTDSEKLFGPVIPVPAGMDSNLAVQAVSHGSARFNERKKEHSNILWMLFEENVILYDELSYDTPHGFSFFYAKEDVSLGGPILSWVVIGILCCVCFVFGALLRLDGAWIHFGACGLISVFGWLILAALAYSDVRAPSFSSFEFWHNVLPLGAVMIFLGLACCGVGCGLDAHLVRKKKEKRRKIREVEAAAAAAS